jgi:tetratricopeptide (TPR) repeat protein
MMPVIRLLATGFLLWGGPLLAAEGPTEARCLQSDGALAVQVDPTSEWRILRTADAVPGRCRLRSAPAEAIPIALPRAQLFLGPDSDIDFDLATRQITCRKGSVRLVVDQSDANGESWKLAVGRRRVITTVGSEVTILEQEADPAIHVLNGTIRIEQPDHPELTFTAPAANVTARTPKTNVEELPGGPEKWRRTIRQQTEPSPLRGVSRMICRDEETGKTVSLNLSRYHVHVELRPPMALVQIDQSFFNPAAQVREGTFDIHLPQGASVSRFATSQAGGTICEGEILPRHQAGEIVRRTVPMDAWESNVATANLDNGFRMRVYPIPAKDAKRILLDYTVPLISEHDQVRFELPLLSEPDKTWEDSLSGTIHPPLTTGSLRSTTHPELKFIPQPDGSVTFRSASRNQQPPARLELRYAAPPDRAPLVQSYEAEGEAFNVITLPASLNKPIVAPALPRDVLVLLDTSGNARNLKRVRQAVRAVMAGLLPTDRIQIGCADVAYRQLTDWCQPASPESAAGIKQLEQQFSLGDFDVERVFRQAVKSFEPPMGKRRQLLVYLGDGPADPDAVQFDWPDRVQDPAAPRPQFVAVSVCSHLHGHPWLRNEAERTDGLYFDLDRVGESMSDLFEWSLAGYPTPSRIDSLEIDGIDSEQMFRSVTWRCGRDYHIYTRGCSQDPVQVSLTMNGQPKQSLQISCKPSPGPEAILIGRMWAEQKLMSLREGLDQLTSEGQLRHSRHCQEWGLASPLTAFLVLEDEADFATWKIDRKLRRRYWSKLVESPPASPVPPQTPVANSPAKTPRLTHAQLTHVRQYLDLAEQALDRARPEQARQFLSTIQRQADQVEVARYRDLNRRVEESLRPGRSLSQLGPWRGLADRRAIEILTASGPRFLFQFSHGDYSPEFLKRHPHAREMLRIVNDCPAETTLTGLAQYVQQRTRIRVTVDKQALQDEGISPDQEIFLVNLQGITLRSLLKEVLPDMGIVCISQHDHLQFTSMSRCEEIQSTTVYPVADLVQSFPEPTPERLANPYLEIEETARRRISRRLKQPISVHFQDAPLEDAVDAVAQQIKTPIRLDKYALQDEGIPSDMQVSLQVDNQSTEATLQELLEPLGLTIIIENELLKVTTQSKADEMLESRWYSYAGFESLPDRPQVPGLALPPELAAALQNAAQAPRSNGVALGSLMTRDFISHDGSTRTDALAELSYFGLGKPKSPDADAIFQILHTKPGSSAREMINLIQQTAGGKWMEIDQEGGAINAFPLSQTLLIRQTAKVHRDISRLIQDLRQKLPSNQWTPVLRDSHRLQEGNYVPLIAVLENDSRAKWMDIDGEGGMIEPQLATKTLVIRQTADAHEQVLKTLTQLRRARYVANRLVNRTSLDGIDEPSLFDDRSLTEWPRNVERPMPSATDAELQWLAARKPQAALHQRWRIRSRRAGQSREIVLRQTGPRRELELPDRTIRSDGSRSAVAYPGLAIVEIDAWSEAAGQLVDSTLPWLPHRCNKELAELFEIALESQDESTITLRFQFPGLSETYLRPTFSKTTGEPVAWKVVAGKQPQFELQFSPKAVVAVDPDGKELERWDLIANEAPRPIPALTDNWGPLLVVDIANPTTPYASAREVLRQRDYLAAAKELRLALNKQPDSPLVNFLYAWALDAAGAVDDESLQEIQAALARVVISDAGDLVRMVTSANFPSAGCSGILLAVPEDRRSGHVWTMLAESAQSSGRHQVALTFLNRAFSLPARPIDMARRRLMQAELLMLTDQLHAAIDAFKKLDSVSDDDLLRFADLFARHGGIDFSDTLYERYRLQTAPTGLVLAQLLEHQATRLPVGPRRWDLLIQASMAVPAEHPLRQQSLDQITADAREAEHLKEIASLADRVADPAIALELRMHCIDMQEDREEAGRVLIGMMDSGRIPAERFHWAIVMLTSAERFEDVVRLVEAKLRAREDLHEETCGMLTEAYERLGREVDASRARSHPNSMAF